MMKPHARTYHNYGAVYAIQTILEMMRDCFSASLIEFFKGTSSLNKIYGIYHVCCNFSSGFKFSDYRHFWNNGR